MFVHRTDLPANAGALFEGRPVSFEIDRTHRGRRAINIALISHSSDRGVAAEKANPMKPPLPRIETTVPRTLHAQLEIAKAVRTLTAPNGDDPQRQRGVEIAAIGQDLEALARDSLGNRILRPDDLPPERYLRAGFANQSLGTDVSGYEQQIAEGGAAAEGASAAGPLAAALLPVSPGGILDAERFDGNYVRDYRHYLNIMIGVYAAAAGLKQNAVLSTIDDYASLKSTFNADELLDEIYTHSAKQDVEDTKSGYRLYESGRIRLRR